MGGQAQLAVSGAGSTGGRGAHGALSPQSDSSHAVPATIGLAELSDRINVSSFVRVSSSWRSNGPRAVKWVDIW